MAKILIADDDEILSALVRYKLEAAGHEVRLVADGEAALMDVVEVEPDLIILDSMMPGLTGPEVLSQLKLNPWFRHVPVIMLTARRGEQDVVEALRGGAADYLTKPFIPEELVVRVSSALARRAGDAARRGA